MKKQNRFPAADRFCSSKKVRFIFREAEQKTIKAAVVSFRLLRSGAGSSRSFVWLSVAARHLIPIPLPRHVRSYLTISVRCPS